MLFLLHLVHLAIQLYIAIIVIQVALHWLVAFEVVNIRTPQARNLVDLLDKATNPIMKPLQNYVPPIGGIDITPVVAIVGLQLFESLLYSLFT